MSNFSVIKRNGKQEHFNIEKINKVLQWATQDLTGVTISDIEINAKLNLREGVTSKEIHEVLIDTSATLISEEHPNYQFVASRLMNYSLRKDVWGGKNPPRLSDFFKEKVEQDQYCSDFINKYTKEEIKKIDEFLDHDRDFDFTYAGLKQLCDKYLIRNRITGQIFETPQFALVSIAMVLFQNYTADKRLQYVKRAYNYFSKHKINLATPIMAGARTKTKSYASCCLIDVEDSMDSIFAGVSAVGHATAKRYGIGINMGRLRSINTPIRNGEVVHTGAIPFLKVFESTAKSCQQGGLRGGGATVNFPIWTFEIEDILQLKNNARNEESSARKLDYCISLSKLFYERFLENKDITLFSMHEVRDLYDAFGHDHFDELYLKYEKDLGLKFKKTISARKLFSLLVKERVETGRIYINNIDHTNSHGSWDLDVKTKNLCVEIDHPLVPLKSLEDPNGEIGVCILSAVNILKIQSDAELEKVCDVVVRMLDELIDVQEYFNIAAKNFATKRRSIAVGLTNLAAYFAKHELKYGDPDCLKNLDELMEKFQYYLLEASNKLAQEKGPCEKFSHTKYSKGILPIDTYKKDVDSLVNRKLSMDWATLRGNIKNYGLRNSTLTAQMPCESSSVIQCSTNGIDPVRSLVTFKASKVGNMPVFVPMLESHGKDYELAFDWKNNEGYLKTVAVIQKYMDMSISANTWYNYAHFPGGKLPDSLVIKELLMAYKYGIKSLYYCYSDDGNKHFKEEKTVKGSCESGACAI